MATDNPKKLCGACFEEFPKESFSKKQWQQKQRRRCTGCIESGQDINVTKLENLLANGKPSAASNNSCDSSIEKTEKREKSNTSDKKDTSDLGDKLAAALEQLAMVGGREEENDDDDQDDNPGDYLNELLAVADARNDLGQYSEAGWLYYRGYYAAIHKNNVINDPTSYPIAHKMIQAWVKSDTKSNLKHAHGMAQQTMMMPGHPRYIQQDLIEVERIMKMKGMKVERFGFGFGGMGGFGF